MGTSSPHKSFKAGPLFLLHTDQQNDMDRGHTPRLIELFN